VAKGRVFVTEEPRTLLALDVADGKILWRREITYLDSVPSAQKKQALEQREKGTRQKNKLRLEEQKLNRLKRNFRRSGGDDASSAALTAQSEVVSKLHNKLAELSQFFPPAPIDRLGSASSTPTLSDDAIFAIFGNGVVAKVSFSGQLIWARYLGKPLQQMKGYYRGQAASPVLVDDTVIVPLNHLYGLSATSGDTLWKGDVYQDYGSPVVISKYQTHLVVTPSGTVINVEDGKVVADSLGLVFYSSPVVSDTYVYFVGSREDNELIRYFSAANIQFSAIGQISTKKLWTTQGTRGKTYSSPLFWDGLLYSAGEAADLTIWDTKTGKMTASQLFPSELDPVENQYPSPAYAGGFIFLTNNAGITAVLKPGRSPKTIDINFLEPIRSSLTFSENRIYARTLESIFCLAKK